MPDEWFKSSRRKKMYIWYSSSSMTVDLVRWLFLCDVLWHINTLTLRLTFCWHFQMHSPEWKLFCFDLNSNFFFFARGLIDRKLSPYPNKVSEWVIKFSHLFEDHNKMIMTHHCSQNKSNTCTILHIFTYALHLLQVFFCVLAWISMKFVPMGLRKITLWILLPKLPG